MQFGLIGALLGGESGYSIVTLAMAAYVLDMALADPTNLPHPVRLIGRLLEALERCCRGKGRLRSPELLRRMGLLACLCCLLLTGLLVWGLTLLPWIGWLPALYFSWAGLALGGLRRAGAGTLVIVERGGLDEARQAVSMLVSRDTSRMEHGDLRRSLAESLAENFNDGFVAPYFWLLLAGPVGLWLYKAASTMDSMWGYKTPEWVDFGRAAARLDDALAFIPARLSAALLLVAGRRFKASPFPGWQVLLREAKSMDSPNAGWPMATTAWLCGARMGGPTPYHGAVIDKPVLGPEGPWTAERVRLLLRLLAAAGPLTVYIFSIAAWLLLLFR